MVDHNRLQALAADPHLIESDEERIALMEHVATCDVCAARLKDALEFERKVVRPLRGEWRHVPQRKLEAFKAAGFVPHFSEASSPERWHVLVCPECRSRYDAIR
jgi:hypothetical protein